MGSDAGRGTSTLSGTLTLAANPCTTRPCLPGVALALDSAAGRYFLRRRRRWLRDPSELEEGPAMPGDRIVVTGHAGAGADVDGMPFLTLDVLAVRRDG